MSREGAVSIAGSCRYLIPSEGIAAKLRQQFNILKGYLSCCRNEGTARPEYKNKFEFGSRWWAGMSGENEAE